MTAVTTPHPSSVQTARDKANAWLTAHHGELVQRARYRLRRVSRRHRKDAIAEVIAAAVNYAHSAAQRGRLDQVTPFWSVEYAARNYLHGRRAGRRPTCVMSEPVQSREGIRVQSIDDDAEDESHRHRNLRETLANHRCITPYDQARITYDYPYILDVEQVPAKGQRLFSYLVETHGQGSQTALAGELKITPARATQLKRELGEALSRHDYHGPLGRRPGAPPDRRGKRATA